MIRLKKGEGGPSVVCPTCRGDGRVYPAWAYTDREVSWLKAQRIFLENYGKKPQKEIYNIYHRQTGGHPNSYINHTREITVALKPYRPQVRRVRELLLKAFLSVVINYTQNGRK